MKPTAPQRLALEVVAVRKRRLDDVRRAAERAIRAQVADLVAPARAEYEHAVADADRLGVPKAQIALAVGTTNPKPIREILQRVASARRAQPSKRYARGDRADALTVLLDGDDLAYACESTGWIVADAISSGVDRATFTVTPELALVAETSSYVVKAGRLHPVVAFVRSDPSEALAWWKESQ